MTAEAQDRMPPIPADKMTEAQKKAAAEFTAARGALTGPWAVLLRSPEVVNRARGLSDYLRFNSVLPPGFPSSSFSSRRVSGRSSTNGTRTIRSR